MPYAFCDYTFRVMFDSSSPEKSLIKTAAIILSGVSFITPNIALASTYKALCESTGKPNKCDINIDAKGFSGPNGFIPTGLIAKWFTGGTEDFNAAKATAGGLGGATAGAIGGAILLGPIGLLGGLIGGAIAGAGAGKEVDMFFTVIGYKEDGEKISQSFRFINKKPANKLRMELPMFTGLSIGQERSIEALQAAFKNVGGGSRVNRRVLPTSLGSKNPTSTDIPTWTTYLEERSLAVWAESNPDLADNLKAKLLSEGKVRQGESNEETSLDKQATDSPGVGNILPEKLGSKNPTSTNIPTWTTYLEERSLAGWAESNPDLADNLKAKLIREGKVREELKEVQ